MIKIHKIILKMWLWIKIWILTSLINFRTIKQKTTIIKFKIIIIIKKMKTFNRIWVHTTIVHCNKIKIKILTKINKFQLKMMGFKMIHKRILAIIKIQIILQMIKIFNKIQFKNKIRYIWIMIKRIVSKTI